MQAYEQFLENAKKYVRTADHLLTNTFPLVKDPRMLVSVLHNVDLAYRNIVLFMLNRDVTQGKIPDFDQTDFGAVISLFKARAERRYTIKLEYVKIVEEIYNLAKDHKSSPMEFARHEVFVICSDNYDVKTVTTANLREWIGKAKLFIDEISTKS